MLKVIVTIICHPKFNNTSMRPIRRMNENRGSVRNMIDWDLFPTLEASTVWQSAKSLEFGPKRPLPISSCITSGKLLKIFFFFFFFKLIYLFLYLFLAVLGLRFCARAFSSCGKRGPLFIAARRPLTIAASLVAEHRLQTRRLSSCGSQA